MPTTKPRKIDSRLEDTGEIFVTKPTCCEYHIKEFDLKRKVEEIREALRNVHNSFVDMVDMSYDKLGEHCIIEAEMMSQLRMKMHTVNDVATIIQYFIPCDQMGTVEVGIKEIDTTKQWWDGAATEALLSKDMDDESLRELYGSIW